MPKAVSLLQSSDDFLMIYPGRRLLRSLATGYYLRSSAVFQADTFAGLGKSGGDTLSFGPRITWAALDLGRVHARIKAADARTEASLAFYQRTVLTALEETEGALVDFGNEQSRQQFLETSAEASQKAADLAHQRYEGGVTDFLSELDAERTLLEAQDRLAASQTRTVTALVAVYKELGRRRANIGHEAMRVIARL